MSFRSRIAVVVVAAVSLASFAANAEAAHDLGHASAQKDSFRLQAIRGVGQDTASGRWAFFGGILVDERTGRRTVLQVPANCNTYGYGGYLFGGPWLLDDCTTGSAPGVSLYNLSTKQWTQVTFDQSVGPPGGVCLSETCVPVAVGSDWIELEYSSYHQSNSYFEAQIPTGTFSDSNVTPGGKLAFDLNAPSGTQTLCSPLTYPSAPYFPGGDLEYQPGWMQMLGRFVLVADDRPQTGETGVARVERCGSNTQIKVPWEGLAWEDNAVAAWTRGHVNGIDLRTLKRFSIATPRAVTAAEYPQVALTTKKIFVSAGGKLWAARLP